jgi:hypothetical protein
MTQTTFALGGKRFPFAPRRRTLIMAAPACLSQNPILLHLAVEPFEGCLKGVSWSNRDLTHRLLPPRVPNTAVLLVTVRAIDRAIRSRLKGHLGFPATVGTSCRIHQALATHAWIFASPPGVICRLDSACGTTGRTVTRDIGESPARIKFLFPYCKHKFLMTIAAYQQTISKHLLCSHFLGSVPVACVARGGAQEGVYATSSSARRFPTLVVAYHRHDQKAANEWFWGR